LLAGIQGGSPVDGCARNAISPPLKLLWTFKTGDAVKSSAVACNGKIYIGSNDGYLYALGMDGKLKWKFNAGNSIEAPPLYTGMWLSPAHLKARYLRWTLKQDIKLWEYSTDGQISGSPNIMKGRGKDSSRVLVGSYDYNLHCLDEMSGRLLWHYESGNYINGTPALFGKIAIFGGCDGFLHLINTVNGQLIEKINIETYMASSPAIGRDKAWFGNYDGEFFCLDLRKKKILWKTGGGGPFLSSPAISGNKVVIGSQNKNITCFDASSGTVLWKYVALGKVDASPVISGNLVITASADGWLRILELATGKEVWTYEIGPAIFSTPAVIGNHIIVGADDGNIYMFGK